MREIGKSAPATLLPRITAHRVPIIAIVIALLAFHWQMLHDDERVAAERADARAQAMADTAALALREPMIAHDVPAVMILAERLVRDNHDVLSARVGGKDGKPLAETEAEHADGASTRSARTIVQPILADDGSSAPTAIGTIELHVATRDVEQLSAANGELLAIEGTVALLLCAGLIVLSRRGSRSPVAASAIVRVGTARAPTALSRASDTAKSQARDARAAAASGAARSEPHAPMPSSHRSADDEPVEIALNSPPLDDSRGTPGTGAGERSASGSVESR